jgi:TPR repeat protein
MSFSMSVSDELFEAIELVQVDRPAGLEAVRRLALAGDKSAILNMGLYLSEDSKTVDDAVPWLASAAGFGSADAAWNLAMIAREKHDPNGLHKWIDLAADLGEPDAVKVRRRGYDVSSVIEPCR